MDGVLDVQICTMGRSEERQGCLIEAMKTEIFPLIQPPSPTLISTQNRDRLHRTDFDFPIRGMGKCPR